MGFDIEAAKKAGYSNEEIQRFVSGAESAKKAGYTDAEISNYVSNIPKGAAVAPAPLTSKGQIQEQQRATGNVKQTVYENLPEIIGGTAMAAATGGGAIPAMLAAGLGGAAGQGYKQIGQHITGNPNAPQTGTEAAIRMAKSGGEQLAYEVGGAAIVKAGDKILKPFRPKLTEGAKQAYQLLERYMPKAGYRYPLQRMKGAKAPPLSTAQMTDNRLFDVMHNIAEASMVGGSAMTKHGKYQNEALSNLVGDMADQFGRVVDPEAVGEMVGLVAEGKFKMFKKAVSTPMYNGIAERIPSYMRFNIKHIKDDPAIKKLLRVHPKAQDTASKETGMNIAKMIRDLPEDLDYGTALHLKQSMRSIKDEVSGKNAPAIGLANKLHGLFDSTIHKKLHSYDWRLGNRWKDVNKMYAKEIDKLANPFMKRLIKNSKDNPHRVLTSIFQKHGSKGILKVKRALGEDSKTWKQLKGWYLRDAVEKVQGSGAKFDRELFNFSRGMGEPALRKIFKPTEFDHIKNVTNAWKLAQEKQAQGAGGVLIKFQEGRAAAALMSGLIKPSLATIAVFPEVFARAMLNPKTAKTLITGFREHSIKPAAALKMVDAFGYIEKQLADEDVE